MPTLSANPTLQDFQKYVTQLEQERGFTKFGVLEQSLLLGEEVGELYKAIRKSEAKMGYATKGYDANPAEELADILIMVCAVANRLGIDLEDAFRQKEARNHERTWK
jgi:NTP pyrophosphatase (non-canonical NTP hydrolase)